MNGGGTKTQTVVSNNTPFQASYLTSGFDQAKSDVLGKPQSYFPNSTVVPFSPQTQQSLDLTQQRATNGSPINQAAGSQLTDTLNGSYLNGGNPALQGAIDAATRGLTRNFNTSVIPGINATFEGAGRYGSGAQAQTLGTAAANLGQQIGDISSGMAYQNYNDERQRQLQATGQAPTAANQDYVDLGQLGQVGSINEDLAGRTLQDTINRYNFAQQEPANRIGNYMGLVGGGYGGTQTQSSPLYRNQAAGAIGGALGGAQIGSMFGPYGSGIGAAAGGLLGFL